MPPAHFHSFFVFEGVLASNCSFHGVRLGIWSSIKYSLTCKFPILGCSPWNRKFNKACLDSSFRFSDVRFGIVHFLWLFLGRSPWDQYFIICLSLILVSISGCSLWNHNCSICCFALFNVMKLGCSPRNQKISLPFPLKSSFRFSGVRLGIGNFSCYLVWCLPRDQYFLNLLSLRLISIFGCSPWNRKLLMAFSRVFALGSVFYKMYHSF